MKKLINIFISMKTMVVLTLIFAAACAKATFIENDHGTETAWAIVYGTRWFEILMLLLAINLIGNIFRFKLYKKEKFPTLLFHAGFLVILIGAAITRYIGFEGTMHIREGATSHQITTSNSFIQIDAIKEGKNFHNEQKILFSKLFYNDFKIPLEKILFSKLLSNDFEIPLQIDGKLATLRYKNYIADAVEKITPDENGDPIVKMLLLKEGDQPNSLILKHSTPYHDSTIDVTLNDTNTNSQKPYIHIYNKDNNFFFKSNKDMTWFVMADKSSGNYKANTEYPFTKGRLYALGNTKLVPRDIEAKAIVQYVNSETAGGRKMKTANKSVVIATLTYDGQSKDIIMKGFGKGTVGIPVTTQIGDTTFTLQWGSKLRPLPFSIKLLDFQLDRYPGSMSPASYASEVILIDKEQHIKEPFRIYMNHILDHRGYRLFQASYDRDEKGTVLSVNNDPGKNPTYLGYFMLALGFILTIFNPKSRFRKLANAVKKDTMLKTTLFFLTFTLAISNNPLQASDANTIVHAYQKAHAEKFGDILIQTVDGRIKPMDTFANEVLTKIHTKTSVDGLNANQVILGMLTSPNSWQEIKLIHVKHTKIKKILSMPDDEKYASLKDFYDNGKYKLANYADEAMRKRPIMRNQFDRSIMKIDEKLNITYMIFTGQLLKLMPKIDDPMQKWYSINEAIPTFPAKESSDVKKLFIDYFSSIDQARLDGNWSNPDKNVAAILAYQHKTSADIIPSERKLKAEKFFKRYGITNKLILVYLFTGLVLLGLIMIKMIKHHIDLTKATKVVQSIFLLAFATHALVLAARWYIGGHAPWSNAYEAMLYVAWSMALAGVIFMKYSPMVPSLTSIIAGSTLAATFFNEMNPQITNLVPVLKSYWLNIHVSMITASYGFLGLSMILGMFTLVLFILRKQENIHIDHSITEASRINEMTAIVGLFMLTFGNFLGGIWANESWGRYWGWDPKETWAWISILVYVAILHLRFIPWFKKNYEYKYAVASTVAYSSIVMTFVGVNYYLSGMHSYAAGDPMPIPNYLYVTIAAIFALIFAASFKRDKKPS